MGPVKSWQRPANVRDDLSARFLSAGGAPPSAGLIGQTDRLARRPGKKGGHYSAQFRGGKNRGASRDDAEPGFGAISGSRDQSPEPLAGKTFAGRSIAFCRVARAV